MDEVINRTPWKEVYASPPCPGDAKTLGALSTGTGALVVLLLLGWVVLEADKRVPR